MFLSMIIGAGLAVWSVIGIALIGWMVYAYRKDRHQLGSVIMLAVAWLCVSGAGAWAILE